MLPTDGQPDLDGLTAWRAALSRQANELRAELLKNQSQLAHVEERLILVTKLIEVETRDNGAGGTQDGAGTPTVPPAPSTVAARSAVPNLEASVEEILRAAGTPLHISEIREALVARDTPIPGRGDDANIIVRLRRFEDRFTRTARGTYGLAEWGLPAVKTVTRKRRRMTAQ